MLEKYLLQEQRAYLNNLNAKLRGKLRYTSTISVSSELAAIAFADRVLQEIIPPGASGFRLSTITESPEQQYKIAQAVLTLLVNVNQVQLVGTLKAALIVFLLYEPNRFQRSKEEKIKKLLEVYGLAETEARSVTEDIFELLLPVYRNLCTSALVHTLSWGMEKLNLYYKKTIETFLGSEINEPENILVQKVLNAIFQKKKQEFSQEIFMLSVDMLSVSVRTDLSEVFQATASYEPVQVEGRDDRSLDFDYIKKLDEAFEKELGLIDYTSIIEILHSYPQVNADYLLGTLRTLVLEVLPNG